MKKTLNAHNFPESPWKKTRITLEDLRQCKGFEEISDEEGEEVIDTLALFSILCYKTFQKENEKQTVFKN